MPESLTAQTYAIRLVTGTPADSKMCQTRRVKLEKRRGFLPPTRMSNNMQQYISKQVHFMPKKVSKRSCTNFKSGTGQVVFPPLFI